MTRAIPDGAALLDLSEAARSLSPPRAALAMLGAFAPELADGGTHLDVGRRDALLLEARAHWFGPVLRARAECPACGVALEVMLDADTLGAVPPGDPVLRAGRDGVSVAFRLPTSADLLAAEAAPDAAAMKRVLLERCLLEGEVSPLVEAIVAEACERAAPGADIAVALRCAACAHAWTMPFDVLGFLAQELEWRADRLMAEVHALAQLYHWSEAAILAMPAGRRRRYLALAAA